MTATIAPPVHDDRSVAAAPGPRLLKPEATRPRKKKPRRTAATGSC